jgi:hypothetical protein
MGLVVCLLAGVAQAQTKAAGLVDMQRWTSQGWHDLGRVHVRDNAEKDLAFPKGGDNVVQIRLGAEGAYLSVHGRSSRSRQPPRRPRPAVARDGQEPAGMAHRADCSAR